MELGGGNGRKLAGILSVYFSLLFLVIWLSMPHTRVWLIFPLMLLFHCISGFVQSWSPLSIGLSGIFLDFLNPFGVSLGGSWIGLVMKLVSFKI